MYDREDLLPSCSVVICTRNRPEYLTHCLQGVARLEYPRFDVVVVDNAPKDGQTREVAAPWGVRYIVEPIPGLSRARNRGARASEAEIIAYIDDDELPERDWLYVLTREFNDPLVMAVAGRVLPLTEENEIERLWSRVGWFGSRDEERRVVDRQNPAWFELTNFGGVGCGGNMAFRRQAFDLWPGFNDRLGRGTPLCVGEEAHAFFSLVQRGYRVVRAPHAIVRHPSPRNVEDVSKECFRRARTAASYLTFLLAEEPLYRRATMGYITRMLCGKQPRWRYKNGKADCIYVIPKWRFWLPRLSGVWLYVSSRVRPSIQTHPYSDQYI